MANRRHIGRSFLNRNTGRTPAATLVRRVGRRPAPPAVIRQVHRRVSIGTTWVLAVYPVLLSGGPSLPQGETIPYTVSILRHVHLWSRNLMTAVSSVVSWHLPNLPASGISVLGPLLLLLHHDTFQRMAIPPTTTMRDRRAQGCRLTVRSPPRSSPLPKHPSNLSWFQRL